MWRLVVRAATRSRRAHRWWRQRRRCGRFGVGWEWVLVVVARRMCVLRPRRRGSRRTRGCWSPVAVAVVLKGSRVAVAARVVQRRARGAGSVLRVVGRVVAVRVGRWVGLLGALRVRPRACWGWVGAAQAGSTSPCEAGGGGGGGYYGVVVAGVALPVVAVVRVRELHGVGGGRVDLDRDPGGGRGDDRVRRVGDADGHVGFPETGSPESWTVPAGVSSAQVDLYGADGDTTQGPEPAAGGSGALVTATLPVGAGQSYTIVVGKQHRFSVAEPASVARRPAGRLVGRRGQHEPGEGDRHAVPRASGQELEGLELTDRHASSRVSRSPASARCSRPARRLSRCGTASMAGQSWSAAQPPVVGARALSAS